MYILALFIYHFNSTLAFICYMYILQHKRPIQTTDKGYFWYATIIILVKSYAEMYHKFVAVWNIARNLNSAAVMTLISWSYK